MITAGIDVGLELTKVVILKDGEPIARVCGPSGGVDRVSLVEKAWNEALAIAGITAADVDKAVATGQGKHDAAFAAGQVTEPIADARAALALYPQATSVVDMGADQVRVVSIGEGGKIREVVLNQKCAAGIGIFLKYMSRRLGLVREDFTEALLDEISSVKVWDGCVVFAELDALGLLNRGHSPREIAGAMVRSMAVRVNTALNDKIVPDKKTTVLVGGLAKNAALVRALRERSGIDFIIPAEPEYVCAHGAAITAGL